MKVASWNINGIRACIKKGLWNWIETGNYDVIAFQETKISIEDFKKIAPTEYVKKNYSPYFFSAEKKGYSGVAFLVKKGLKYNISPGTGIKEFDSEGRLITLTMGKWKILNGYYPNGQRDHNRVPYKLRFSEYILKTSSKLVADGYQVILCGDFNTAHEAIDLANPKTNTKTTGFLPIERQFITKLVNNGFKDIFREQNPNENGHYTWWTYRNNCREKNVGWRIDYFFCSENISQKLLAKIEYDVLGSDHCPVTLEVQQ